MGSEDVEEVETVGAARVQLLERLRGRSQEIAEQIFSDVRPLPGEGRDREEDHDYLAGLSAAIVEGVEYGLCGIGHSDEWWNPPPRAAMAQARLAAHLGVTLETVLCRYATGDRVLREYVIEEADHIEQAELRGLLKGLGASADRFMRSVASEFMGEIERLRQSPTTRHEERVQRLLAADGPVDVGDLEYDLDGWHIGVVGKGPDAYAHAQLAATKLDRKFLVCHRREGTVEGWFGGRQEIELGLVERVLGDDSIAQTRWAVGDPRTELDGWRLTYREAQAAYSILLRSTRRTARARGTILLAAVARDPSLSKSLHETYVVPLGSLGGSARPLRTTLLAYLRSGLNAASAAAALDIDRSTVQRHLRRTEETLGGTIHACSAELQIALELAELNEVEF
jgi:hypothetical protein